MAMDRRDFMVAGGIVAAGAALAPLLASGLPAQASTNAPSQAPGYYSTKIGTLRVTSLLDGGMTLGDELMLNAKAGVLQKAREDQFLNGHTKDFPAFVNAFVVESAKKVTLIDTGGVGMAPNLGHVQGNLTAAGYDPARIDDIILTHAHPDHTNGLLDAGGKPLYTKARVRVHEAELAFWFDDAQKEKFKDRAMLFDAARKNLGPYKDAGKIETYKSGADFGGGLSSVFLPGHTPGHSGVRISDGKDQLMIWGDIVHVPAVQFAHPDVSIAFDIDPSLAATTRAKIFDELAADRIALAGMHLVFPARGHLAKDGAGYRFVADYYDVGGG